MPFVVIAFRAGEPDRFVNLTDREIIIGRDPEASLVLPDTTVSRNHAKLRISKGNPVIEDLASTNGVFVNGEQIRSSILREGDFITLGAYTLVLRAVHAAGAPQVPKGKTLYIGRLPENREHPIQLRGHSPAHAAAMFRIAFLMGRRAPLETRLREVLALVSSSVPAQHGYIILRAPETGDLSTVAAIGAQLDPNNLPINKSLIDYVSDKRVAVLSEDAKNDPRFLNSSNIQSNALGSAMCVPLCSATTCPGIIFVDSGKDTGFFTEHDLEFLGSVGHVLAITVENDRLLNRSVEQERHAAVGLAIAEISHDIRNSFTGIKLGAEMMEEGKKQHCLDTMAEAGDIIRKCAEDIETYLINVLEAVKEIRINRTPTNIHELVENAVRSLTPRAAEQKVALQFKGGGFAAANVDGPQLYRALVNIIRNAIEACGLNGGNVSVSVGWRMDTLMIQIADTGGGILETDYQRIFQPFFASKERPGAGLGLTMSKRIVELHGGKITVNSQVGHGSIFTLIIPRCSMATSTTNQDEPLIANAGDTIYRRCPGCGTTWESQDNMLADPAIAVTGYRARFEELTIGQLMFQHTCGTVLAVPAGDFVHLYDGPVFAERRTGKEDCPGYCLQERELGNCPAQCECAYIREVLQLIKAWPKQAKPSLATT